MELLDSFRQKYYKYCKHGCGFLGGKNIMFIHENNCIFGMVYDQSGFPLYREEQEIPF